MTVAYADENAFQTADPRRRTSDEVDLGATWRTAGSDDAWRLAWLRDTGELYLCQAGGYPGPSQHVRVLAVIPSEAALDAVLDGWRDHRTDEDGLAWLRSRVSRQAA
ncbi:MAG: hypothetical protein JWO27_469 [Frankiales bacterium]|jgi:hypothetical protein|nr:hypothetical protein [Frankiales bacterium]MCW2707090.1 hypothetical protein [Frankiales bacterium]